MVLLNDPDAEKPSDRQRWARVCGGCAERGVLVVSVRKPPVIRQEVGVDERFAEAMKKLRAYGKAAALTAETDGGGEIALMARGRAEGFEGAVALLRQLCGKDGGR